MMLWIRMSELWDIGL